ncbi:TPA: TonB-dependent hemoglobin/transferrin/lactoferrin family receptor, partial [Haemophilus influenzae]
NVSEQLEQINVSGSTENSDSKTPPKIAETVKTAKTLEREQANNIKDIVKYETGVTVVEAGRFGQSGFAIRGVDENRVAINIDGLRQAETLSSQGFKELFEGYGNFNNTRNGAEIETLKEVNITKGANSIKSGSGSLGGSVIYKTKDARDYLLNKDYYVSYKKGYATENNQSFNTLTLAGRYKKFDALVVTTRRNGHELENYDYKNADSLTQGKKREKADPYKIEQDSTLLKLSFNPTENHRFTLAADLYEHRSRGQDLSYTLKYLKTLDLPEDDSRHTNDKTKRRNISFSYENFSQTPFWDTLKITFSKQKIKTRARTDEYCDAGVRDCEGTANPAGLTLTNGKITRRDGSELEFKKKDGSDEYDFSKLIDTNEKEIESGITRKYHDEVWYDCLIFDCENPSKMKVAEGTSRYGYFGKWKNDVELETKVLNDRKFARIKNGNRGKTFPILPSSPGYLERLWQERDLDTNTQQLNLDLTKDFKTWRVEHNLQYGSSYNTTMKRMVNRAGYDATDVQWWAKRTLGTKTDYFKKPLEEIPETCENTSSSAWNAFLCPRVDPEFSYLLPIKTKEKSVYLFDNVVITDYLSFDLGYRYDNIHYQPKYKHGVTPKLPDDIVKELFIPLDNKQSNDANKVKENVQKNIDYIAKQNKKYKAHSYSFVSTIDPTNFLRLQLKYSKGFRAPTSDEMYFTFKHPDFTILPNTNLKPEIAKTKEIAFTLHNDDWGFISTSLFKTNYKNFIDLVYKGTQSFKLVSGGDTLPFSLYQNINRDSAVVKGIEINSKVFLGKMAKFMDGFNLSYKYTYQKGRMDGNIPMNAIQPKTMVYGLGYDHPSQKFGFNFYTTHVATKNPEDTYDIYAKDKQQTDTSIKWRSKSYTILDLIGYVQPIKNLTIRAGVYNLTNRKYITWDSARSIRSFGTSNVIEQTTGLGINRFYAPGRNYKMSVQFEF